MQLKITPYAFDVVRFLTASRIVKAPNKSIDGKYDGGAHMQA